ncbi:MAG: metallophosphoesterase [Thermoguttaceae bacterium]|nr:metallophosphoesterase [Thermoguttaceae bacterium]
MNRREFLTRGAAFCSAATLAPFLPAWAQEETPQIPELKITSITVSLPIEREFTALHISDSHLAYADDRDSEEKRARAEKRVEVFRGHPLETLHAALSYAEEKGELLLHTGDMIDFVTAKNLDLTSEALANRDCLLSAGNHDFYPMQGDGAVQNEEYKIGAIQDAQPFFPNDMRFCARVINGVNFIAFDDAFYYVADDLIDRFKAEAAKGLPIVAMCHCPLYTPELYKHCVENRGDHVALIVGASDEEMAHYPESYFKRYRWGHDEQIATRAFVDYLRGEPLLKAVLCGHLHFPWQGRFSDTAAQYIAGANFKGDVNEIKFVPTA